MLATSQPTAFVSTVTLIAQEESIPPFGMPVAPDRPIGFASVFLALRNPLESQQTLIIQSIQIVNAETGTVELRQDAPQSVTLMPLEHATVDVHLSNQTAYLESGPVKAIATYTIAKHPLERQPDSSHSSVHVIESAAVDLL